LRKCLERANGEYRPLDTEGQSLRNAAGDAHTGERARPGAEGDAFDACEGRAVAREDLVDGRQDPLRRRGVDAFA
jgi:hypothetical protein